MRQIAADLFPDRFDFADRVAPVTDPPVYHRLLAPLGSATIWETASLQQLAPISAGHPVRGFTASTAMRPFSDRLSQEDLDRFVAAYDAALATAYPAEADGSVLFPFGRLVLLRD